jgi:hypothetical protein
MKQAFLIGTSLALVAAVPMLAAAQSLPVTPMYLSPTAYKSEQGTVTGTHGNRLDFWVPAPTSTSYTAVVPSQAGVIDRLWQSMEFSSIRVGDTVSVYGRYIGGAVGALMIRDLSR